MEDQRIIALLFQRAEAAIDALSKKFGQRLYRTAMNILSIREDTEEAVSDTYLAVWNAVPPKQPDPLAGFVYKIGRNIALTKQRDLSAQKRSSRYDVPLQELEGVIAGPDLLEQVTARELGRAIDAFLSRQTAENRALFLRRYWFGDSIRDIARTIHMTENAVSVRLSRTRYALKAYLTEEGFYEP